MIFSFLSDVNSYDVVEYVFEGIPFILIGLVLIILSKVLKQKRISKFENAPEAKVVKIEDDFSGYIHKYIIYLEFLYNGKLVTGIYKSSFRYHIGTIVKVVLYGDKVGEILSDIPNDIEEQETIVSLRLDAICKGIGWFFLIFSMLGVLTNLMDYSDSGVTVYVFLTFVFGLVLYFFYNEKKKAIKKIDIIKGSNYELLNVKVVGSDMGWKRLRKTYFPIVEYTIGGTTIKRVFKEDVIINAVDDKDLGMVEVYRNKEKGDLCTESNLKEEISFYNTLMIITGLIYVFLMIFV